jgi:hypothetical protein
LGLRSKIFRKPGTQATLRGVGKKVAWAYPTVVVCDRPDLIGLYLPAGVFGKNVEKRPSPGELLTLERINIVNTKWERTDVLMLIVPGEAFSTYLMWEAGTKKLTCWYINLQEPIRRTSIGYDTMDLMLDVVVEPDLSAWKWKDEDEFFEAERIGYYSHKQAQDIRSHAEKAIDLLTSKRRSFYMEWEKWQADPDWAIPKLSPFWEQLELPADI